MKRFVQKNTRFIVTTLALAILLSSGAIAFALSDGPVEVPTVLRTLSANVAENIYVQPEIEHDYEEAVLVDDEIAEAAAAAVASAATELQTATGIVMRAAAPPISVSIEAPNTVIRFTLPEGYNAADVTTLAALTAGTLRPVPTRIEGNYIITLLNADTVLVPLNVEANFTDIDFGPQFANVTDEINRAASMMIVQGQGQGVFAPTTSVTVQDAATMFLRAMGVPVEWGTAIQTAVAVGLTDGVINPSAPLSRVSTAVMIANALDAVGVDVNLTPAQVDQHLAPFTDLGGLDAAQREALAITVSLGIFRGAGDGLMDPDQPLRRSAIASLSVRLQDVFLGT
ncbi:MAG: S-layer homology domain-containing protein [Oscillospiraceae bacterium]|nr:S-layer homology domain-containing protein [Oscillospiraceae bacterium]